MDDTTLIPREDLKRLAHLPPTAELEEAVAKMKSDARSILMPMALKAAEKRARDGAERDRLQAQRPDGCTCLGLGFAERVENDPSAFAGVSYTARNYCGCPEGIAAKAEADARDESRRRRDVAAYIERAGIPRRFLECTFDSFPGKPKMRDQLATHAARGEYSLFLYGTYGCGKTGLASAMLKDRIAQTCSAGMFVTVPNLLDAIRATYAKDAEQSESQLLDRVKKVPFLVLDDIGAEKVTDWVQEKLFSIINHRHDEDLATLFTSNLTVDELGKHIGERTVWRIVEMCQVVHVDGPNLRAQR